MRTNSKVFQFKPFSKKQRMILNWWTTNSPVSVKNGIIADGAIRTGKTMCMSLSFVLWAMNCFDRHNFGMCGKTIGSFRRNVLSVLKLTTKSRGYVLVDHRADNMFEIRKNGRVNYFYIFGGKDESSQDLIQGITLAGAFFDEVALMPESFVNQATARCSVSGSKLWFNCNPEGPSHWFYREWITRSDARALNYLHFDLDDNWALSEDIKTRYRQQYSGVFYERFILGLWVIAEGVIYDMFDRQRHVKPLVRIAPLLTSKCYVSCDYGTQNPTVFLMWVKGIDHIWYCIREYYYSGRKMQKQKTDAEYVRDMQSFIGDAKPRAVIVDPSAASFIEALRQAGIPTILAKNDVLDGIRQVAVCLNTDCIIYSEFCKNTIEEYGSYVWDEKAAARGVDAPVKENDHAMDATRYFVNTILSKKAVVRDKYKKGIS